MKNISLDGFCERTGFSKRQAKCILQCIGSTISLQVVLNLLKGRSLANGIITAAVIGIITSAVIAPPDD